MSTHKTAIAWIDLKYSISGILRQNKTLLDRVNGSVDFGSLTALMGPSGAGKTTLLRCLNGKHKSGLSSDSKIYVSGKQQLLLSHVMDTRVIDCSGGEQKRVTIALEMTSLVKPNLLCIDEPTTGLDSEAAETIMRSLKSLSQLHNIAIIASIHQPNNEIVQMFDKLYVLSIGGHCIFSGQPKQLQPVLMQCGIEEILTDRREDQTAIELLLNISSINENNDCIQRLIQNQNIGAKRHVLNTAADHLVYSPHGIDIKTKRFTFADLWHLMMRSMLYTYMSQWKPLLLQSVFYILTALITSQLFSSGIGRTDGCYDSLWDVNSSCFRTLESDELLHQNIKFIFLNSVIIMFMPLTITSLAFSSEIHIFLNEHQNSKFIEN
ncbi:ATP-binding cassette sub-family G member 1-like [Oppia nitens]|uniref:ATP-binding cassette sub-family G member 1-like n=1 Tax=Oppia nitens TaxID=1686743 RepID=UPI0023D9850A|nr:ATP-binding cassette sub-family G member 1-like [Oppia nitens]